MTEHTDWRNFWWLDVALLGAAFFVSLFAFPETKFKRPSAEDIHAKNPQSSMCSSQTNIELNGEQLGHNKLEKGVNASASPPLNQGRLSRKQFNLYQPHPRFLESIILDIWTPFKFSAFPIVDFASFVVAWNAPYFLTVNLTQSQAFTAPPYNYTPQTVGFFNFAVVVGEMLGLITAGPLIDWISMRATRLNNGMREPEMRLPAIIPYTLIMILGNFVVAFGYQYHWDWRVNFPSYPHEPTSERLSHLPYELDSHW